MANRSDHRRRQRKKEKERAIAPPTPSPPPQEHALLQHQQVSGELHLGPIPHPDTLKAYGDIAADLPERIVKMAEGEQTHRHEMEREALDANIDDLKRGRSETRLGQVCGLVVGLTALISGAYMAVHGVQWGGSLIGGGTVAALVAVFVYGRKSREPSNEQKK